HSSCQRQIFQRVDASSVRLRGRICRGNEALRMELTAGCLIEKGLSGTIYFGHRSLQEFLVAEHLIATNFDRVSPQDKSAWLWTLDLVTREVGSFIVEATKSSRSAGKIVLGWFDILKGLRRKDMPRTGMRFFMELHGIFADELSRVNEAWFLWLRYFAANETVGFAPKTPAAVEQLSAIIRCLPGTTEQQAAILMLFAEALVVSLRGANKIAGAFHRQLGRSGFACERGPRSPEARAHRASLRL